MRNEEQTRTIWRFKRVSPVFLSCMLALFSSNRSASAANDLFDLDAIIDPKTLQIDILQDWHLVQGPIPTRQKLVTINVADLWPGQEYRVPVRMVVPADRKAQGFHLTGVRIKCVVDDLLVRCN